MRSAWLAMPLLGLLSLAGCSEDPAFGPRAYALSGRVRLIGYLTAADGHFLGTRTVDDADGVPVDLMFGDEWRARTTTVDGAFRFDGVTPGAYVARVRISPLLTASTQVLTVATGGVSAPDPIVVASQGDLYPAPNPSTGRALIHYVLPRDAWPYLRVADVGGRLVRVLSNVPLDAGEHSASWSGADSVGVPVAGSLFWVLYDAGDDQRAQLIFR